MYAKLNLSLPSSHLPSSHLVLSLFNAQTQNNHMDILVTVLEESGPLFWDPNMCQTLVLIMYELCY